MRKALATSRKIQEGTLLQISDVDPSKVDPQLVYRHSAFGNNEMECAAAGIAAYAQNAGHWGPFSLDAMTFYVQHYRGLPYWDPRTLPGDRALFREDLEHLKLYGWITIDGDEVMVIPDFPARCLKATHEDLGHPR